MEWDRSDGLETYREGVKTRLAKGVALAAEHILGEANKTVPIEEGTPGLLGSGTTSTEGMHGVVSYDTPYAVRQHEEMDYRHDPGRRAKWLELTFSEERKAVAEVIARTVREEL